MQENISHTLRRWQRQPSKIRMSLVLDADPIKVDDSAFTVDISRRGASVLTKLALVPGEWVEVVAKGKASRAVAAHVVWVREDESSHSTSAGLELF